MRPNSGHVSYERGSLDGRQLWRVFDMKLSSFGARPRRGKSEIDPHRFLEILTGTLFSAPIFRTYGRLIADEHYEPAGFKMTLGLKNIHLALAAADWLLVPMPLAALARLSADNAGLHS